MKKRCVLSAVVVLTLLAAWIWRYTTLNSYYEELSNMRKEVFSIHERVPFGEDYLDKDSRANGYWICVDEFEIVDYQEFIQEKAIILDEQDKLPEKLALVYITLSNTNSIDPGIMLVELDLHGIDSVASMDWDILTAINPVLEGNYGVSLKENSELKLTLPFGLNAALYSDETWNNLDRYNFYLRITNFPTVKDICVTE